MNHFLKINPEKIVPKITGFLSKEFKRKKKTKAILGISGGIDSTTTAFLCKKAGLKVYALNLLCQKKVSKDARIVINSLALPKNQIMTVDISAAVNAQINELNKVVSLDQIDKGNIMARQRMIAEYAIARHLGGLVMGTENLSEYYLGYFTLFGDQACDISPIAGLLKTQVWQLAKYLGVPDGIIKKTPSADLWQGQTDEKELGFSYQKADPIIYLYKIKHLGFEAIVKKTGFKKSLVDKVIRRIDGTEFKREKKPKCPIF